MDLGELPVSRAVKDLIELGVIDLDATADDAPVAEIAELVEPEPGPCTSRSIAGRGRHRGAESVLHPDGGRLGSIDARRVRRRLRPERPAGLRARAGDRRRWTPRRSGPTTASATFDGEATGNGTGTVDGFDPLADLSMARTSFEAPRAGRAGRASRRPRPFLGAGNDAAEVARQLANLSPAAARAVPPRPRPPPTRSGRPPWRRSPGGRRAHRPRAAAPVPRLGQVLSSYIRPMDAAVVIGAAVLGVVVSPYLPAPGGAGAGHGDRRLRQRRGPHRSPRSTRERAVRVLTPVACSSSLALRWEASAVLVPFLLLAAVLVVVSLIDLEHYRHPRPDRLPRAGDVGRPDRRSSRCVEGFDAVFLRNAVIGVGRLLRAPAGAPPDLPRGMGFGDVKLALLMGLYLGWIYADPFQVRSPSSCGPGARQLPGRPGRCRLRPRPRPPGRVPLRPRPGPRLPPRRHLQRRPRRLSHRLRPGSGGRLGPYRGWVLRFLTAGESHGQALVVDRRGPARRAADHGRGHPGRAGPPPPGLRPRPADALRAGRGHAPRRRPPRAHARLAGRHRDRQQRVGARSGPRRCRPAPGETDHAADPAPARPRRPGRHAEVRLHRRPRRARAGLGPRDRGPGRRRGGGQGSCWRTLGVDDRVPRRPHRVGAAPPGVPPRGRRPRARSTSPRCAASTPTAEAAMVDEIKAAAKDGDSPRGHRRGARPTACRSGWAATSTGTASSTPCWPRPS